MSRRFWLVAGPGRILTVAILVVVLAAAATFIATGLWRVAPAQSKAVPAATPAAAATSAVSPKLQGSTGSDQIVAMPDDKIPADKQYAPIEVPADKGAAAANVDPAEFVPFPHLAKQDVSLYQELPATGEAFKLVQGDDGYFHIER